MTGGAMGWQQQDERTSTMELSPGGADWIGVRRNDSRALPSWHVDGRLGGSHYMGRGRREPNGRSVPTSTGCAGTEPDGETVEELAKGVTPGGRDRATAVLAAARKIAVLIVGTIVLVVGVVLVVLPGPAFLVIPAGLAILATEFAWARRLLLYAKDRAGRLLERARRPSVVRRT